MGKYHHSKKAHGDTRKRNSSQKYNLAKAGREKLPENFVYTQSHKNIWNSFCNFMDERFAEEDLSEILDEDEITRIKTPPTIPPLLEFTPENVGDVESEDAKRARVRAQALADKSYASRESQYFEGIKKLAQKFNRATVLLLKHVDALINLDLHQFLKSDAVKRLDPESKYNQLREHFSDHWGPHSSLDVAKIKQELMEMQGDDPGWRKYLQNFNYFVGSLEQTMQRDAADAIIYGPKPAAAYPPRPLATAPAAQHTAYITACQQADEVRDAQYPHGGPALNHRPTDAELKTILLDALSESRLGAYKTLYQQYCNRSHNGKTYQDLYNDIHDLVKYESDGVKSSTRESDHEQEDSDASRSTRGSSRSSNSHSSRRNASIAAAAALQRAQQVAANTSANSNILYQSPGGGSTKNSSNTHPEPCKNCKGTNHGTKWCPSTKCFEKNCGKTFATAEERKAHFIREHGTASRSPGPPKSALKDSGKGQKVKFARTQRLVGKVNRVQAKGHSTQQQHSEVDSEVSSDSSASVDHPPKSIVWKGSKERYTSGRKVSHLRSVKSVNRTTCAQLPIAADDDDDHPPELVDASDDSDDDPDATVSLPDLTEDSTVELEPESSTRQVEHTPTVSDADTRPATVQWSRQQAEASYYGVSTSMARARPRFPSEGKSTPHLSSAESEGEARRIAIQIEEWYQAQSKHPAPNGASTSQSAAQEGTIRIRERDRSEPAPYLTDRRWDGPTESDWERMRTDEANAPYQRDSDDNVSALTDQLVYQYDSDPEECKATQRLEQDHWHQHVYTPAMRYDKYRAEGGRRRFNPADTGVEEHYDKWQPVTLEDGDWATDYNYLRPSTSEFRDPAYREWYLSTHPAASTISEAEQNWKDRRRQLEYCQTNHPHAYGSYIQEHQGNSSTSLQVIADPSTWDNGALYRLHRIREQAAREIMERDRDPVVTERDIDVHLIHEALADNTSKGQEGPSVPEPPDNAMKGMSIQETLEAAVQAVHHNVSRLTPTTRVQTGSNDATTAQPRQSNIRTQKAHKGKLSDRIRQNQHDLRQQINKQRNVDAIVDTGAQVTTMPESAVSRMPNAHNHRDAPPGTAVRYGNGELETIERLVDIGHYEVQVTPDNCSSTLISVDQIVQDGHTVTFSATHTIIADDLNRYRLEYPRAADSREWTMPLTAMEDISRLRAMHPLHAKKA